MNRDDINLIRLRDIAESLGDVAEGEIVEWAVAKIEELEKQPRWIRFEIKPELPEMQMAVGDLYEVQPVRRISGEYLDENGRLWKLTIPASQIESVAAVTWERLGDR